MQRLQKFAGHDAGLEPGSWHPERPPLAGHSKVKTLRDLLTARKRQALLK